MEKEMQRQKRLMVRKVVIQVEQESVQAVLDKSPHKQAHHPETQRRDFVLAHESNTEKRKV